MEISLNELLLYGGAALAGISVIGGILFLCVMARKKKKLAEVLDREYGKESQ